MKMSKRKLDHDVGFGPGKRQEVKLEFPSGEPDLEALRSVTREWLVPRLVEKFLRVHGIEPRSSSPPVLPASANRLTPPINKSEEQQPPAYRNGRGSQNVSE